MGKKFYINGIRACRLLCVGSSNMAKVYNKQFKRFMLALNKVLAGKDAYHRYSKDGGQYDSWAFRYYWQENHEWDGGHFNQVEYQCWYDVDTGMLNIRYVFWWKDKWKEYEFYREVPVNYILFDEKKFLNMVFPFTKLTDYPNQMETEFDFQLDSWIKKQVMEQEMMNSIKKDF